MLSPYGGWFKNRFEKFFGQSEVELSNIIVTYIAEMYKRLKDVSHCNHEKKIAVILVSWWTLQRFEVGSLIQIFAMSITNLLMYKMNNMINSLITVFWEVLPKQI